MKKLREKAANQIDMSHMPNKHKSEKRTKLLHGSFTNTMLLYYHEITTSATKMRLDLFFFRLSLKVQLAQMNILRWRKVYTKLAAYSSYIFIIIYLFLLLTYILNCAIFLLSINHRQFCRLSTPNTNDANSVIFPADYPCQ